MINKLGPGCDGMPSHFARCSSSFICHSVLYTSIADDYENRIRMFIILKNRRM